MYKRDNLARATRGGGHLGKQAEQGGRGALRLDLRIHSLCSIYLIRATPLIILANTTTTQQNNHKSGTGHHLICIRFPEPILIRPRIHNASLPSKCVDESCGCHCSYTSFTSKNNLRFRQWFLTSKLTLKLTRAKSEGIVDCLKRDVNRMWELPMH